MKTQIPYELEAINQYHLELVDSITGEIKQVVDCHNVATTALLGLLRSGSRIDLVRSIALGTGTGTPAATDTALFKEVYTDIGSYSNTANYPIIKRVMSLTMPAGTAYELTEVGTYFNYNNRRGDMYTHALFTDAEGNPIVINKATTDILNVTITIFVTFNMLAHPDEGVNVFMPAGKDSAPYKNLLVLWTDSGNPTRDPAVSFLTRTQRQIDYHSYVHKAAGSGSFNTAGIMNLSTYWAYNQQASKEVYDNTIINRGNGYEIRAFMIEGFGTFNITEEIFPPTPFPKYQVGVGDGVNTDFHIKTPSCKAGTQKVYVDGVIKTEGVDYTFHPYNTKDFPTNFLSADKSYVSSCYLVNNGNYGYADGPWYPLNETTQYVSISNAYPVVFDFLEPKIVNYLSLQGTAKCASLVGLNLEYSNDNVTWNNFCTITAEMLANKSLLRDPITARYWRYSVPSGSKSLANNKEEPPLFTFYKPSIVFTTAPSTNAVIEVEYDIKYPFKNNYHTIGASFHFELTCG